MLFPAGVLHGPSNIAGNPYGLSRAERELGLRSQVVVLEGHAFGYHADVDLEVGQRWDEEAMEKKRKFLRKAMLRHKVFHYSYGGHTFLEAMENGELVTELPMLKRLRRKIIVTFCGDDARPPEASPFVDWAPEVLELQEAYQQKRIDLMMRYADRIFYLNPDLRRYLDPRAEFRPYASVDPRAIRPQPPQPRREMVVAHAPSDRVIKGTQYVIDAVESLRSEGVPIRLEMIEGVPHDEVVPRMLRADVVVDQLNQGWYGAFAVEAMATQRPALAYIDDREPGDNPFGSELGVVPTTRETLRDDLAALVADPGRRAELGARGREFVERHHDPRVIARRNLEGLVRLRDPAR
jgi:glycosyltransferase involved in cell wall biosynthesis